MIYAAGGIHISGILAMCSSDTLTAASRLSQRWLRSRQEQEQCGIHPDLSEFEAT
jgi:hypothetical protein